MLILFLGNVKLMQYSSLLKEGRLLKSLFSKSSCSSKGTSAKKVALLPTLEDRPMLGQSASAPTRAAQRDGYYWPQINGKPRSMWIMKYAGWQILMQDLRQAEHTEMKESQALFKRCSNHNCTILEKLNNGALYARFLSTASPTNFVLHYVISGAFGLRGFAFLKNYFPYFLKL